jgi:hypothetical protein
MRLALTMLMVAFVAGCGVTAGVARPDAGGPCPEVAPVVGAACSGGGLACSDTDPRYSPAVYGSSACATECTFGAEPRYSCRPDLACVDGGWALQRAALAPVYPCAAPPAESCPETFDAAVGAGCGAPGAVCSFGSRSCVCTVCTGGCPENADGGVPVTWECDPAPSSSACPSATPNLGTACSTDELTCTFGNCAAGTWIEAKCVDAVWKRTNAGCGI